MPRKSKEQIKRERRNETYSKYHKKSFKNYHIAFHLANDAEVIAKLEEVPNKIDYIRSLIKRDINEEK